jgi:hypothetical protein
LIFFYLVVLLSTLLFLFWAKFFLSRLASTRAFNPGLSLMQALDRFWEEQNRLWAGGIHIINEKFAALPDSQPVYWRETAKSGFGRISYLIRLQLLLVMPIFIPLSFYILLSNRTGSLTFHVLFNSAAYLLWLLTVLVLAGNSAGRIGRERAQQTLSILATTPLSDRAILDQKIRAVHKISWILLAPVLVFYLIYLLALLGVNWYALLNWVLMAVLLFSYARMVTWVGFWLGLSMKSQAGAMIAAVAGWGSLQLLPLLSTWPQGKSDFLVRPGIYLQLWLILLLFLFAFILLLTWICFWREARIKNRSISVLGIVAGTGIVLLLPLGFYLIGNNLFIQHGLHLKSRLMLFNPMDCTHFLDLFVNDRWYSRIESMAAGQYLFLNITTTILYLPIYLGVWFFFRQFCRRHANFYLGRISATEPAPLKAIKILRKTVVKE